MQGRKRELFRFLCRMLPILFCLAALVAKCFCPWRLERLQEAVFGAPAQQVEAAFSDLRRGETAEVFSFLED